MNWVDLAILAVIATSALLAFMRGFVREVMGIGAWIGAGFFAIWAFPFVIDRFLGWIENPDVARPVAFGVMFLAGLLVLNIVAGMIGAVVRGSLLGGIDRTLGVAFGIARGAILVVFAYILAGLVVTADRWPDVVLQARSLPYAYAGAVWVVNYLPEDYRPRLAPPPGERETRAADLLRVAPSGRALTKP